MRTVTRKVPGGKLLRLKCGLNEGRITAPQLSGDFFLMPPEKIAALEEALEGFPVDSTDLKDVLDYVVERERIRLSGITTADIVAAVEELE